MRIRLTELKRIIRSEVRRALHEELPAGMVGDAPEEPTPEDIAAAKKAVEKIIANASGEDAEEVADLLESLSSRRVLRNKAHYYNRIIRKSLHEGAAGAFVGSLLTALIGSNILPAGSGPEAITALIAAGGVAGSMLGDLLGKFATNKKIDVPD